MVGGLRALLLQALHPGAMGCCTTGPTSATTVGPVGVDGAATSGRCRSRRAPTSTPRRRGCAGARRPGHRRSRAARVGAPVPGRLVPGGGARRGPASDRERRGSLRRRAGARGGAGRGGGRAHAPRTAAELRRRYRRDAAGAALHTRSARGGPVGGGPADAGADALCGAGAAGLDDGVRARGRAAAALGAARCTGCRALPGRRAGHRRRAARVARAVRTLPAQYREGPLYREAKARAPLRLASRSARPGPRLELAATPPGPRGSAARKSHHAAARRRRPAGTRRRGRRRRRACRWRVDDVVGGVARRARGGGAATRRCARTPRPSPVGQVVQLDAAAARRSVRRTPRTYSASACEPRASSSVELAAAGLVVDDDQLAVALVDPVDAARTRASALGAGGDGALDADRLVGRIDVLGEVVAHPAPAVARAAALGLLASSRKPCGCQLPLDERARPRRACGAPRGSSHHWCRARCAVGAEGVVRPRRPARRRGRSR